MGMERGLIAPFAAVLLTCSGPTPAQSAVEDATGIEQLKYVTEVVKNFEVSLKVVNRGTRPKKDRGSGFWKRARLACRGA